MALAVADRILACFKGIATGDAIGKQTEMLSHESIRRWYPDGVRGFEGSPGAVIPRYVGNRKREWRIGETTDDTERTIAVARAIIADGDVTHAGVGREMLPCTKSVHPGVRVAGDRRGRGNGGGGIGRHRRCVSGRDSGSGRASVSPGAEALAGTFITGLCQRHRLGPRVSLLVTSV
jgi:hypothetical protein